MRVLAIETATPVASVALVGREGVEASRAARAPMRHLEWLAAAIDGMLGDAGIRPDGVEAVAVGRGPGGFTGLRIGIATAAAWGRARRVPVLGVGTLETLAASVDGGDVIAAGGVGFMVAGGGSAGEGRAERLVLPVLDAYRGEVAAALYRCGPESAPACLVPAAVAAPDVVVAEMRAVLEAERAAHHPLVVAGDGLVRHAAALLAALAAAGIRRVIEHPDASPSAAAAGLLARPRLLRGARDDTAGLLPLYGRRPAVRPWQETSTPPGTEG